MKIIESTATSAEPMRRITIELPESRAKELKSWLSSVVVWRSTDFAGELETLHEALGGWDE